MEKDPAVCCPDALPCAVSSRLVGRKGLAGPLSTPGHLELDCGRRARHFSIPSAALGEVVVQHAALVLAGEDVRLGELPPTCFPALLS